MTVLHKTENLQVDCVFCSIVKKGSKEKYDKILYESDNFIVLPAKGHFSPGYLLIITKEHYCSFASIPHEELHSEWKEIYNLVKSALGRIYRQPVILFEHGSIFGGGYAGNTIEHAHLHIIPCVIDLAKALADDGRKIKGISSLESLRSINKPYLFVSSGNFNYVAEVEHEMQGQYLRKLLYDKLISKNDDGWNWRVHVHEDILESTLAEVSKVLEGMSYDKE